MDHNDMIIGSRVPGGGAAKFETGDWRSLTPIVDRDTCIDCMTCWIYCPDNSIVFRDNKMSGIKLTHCKGCGICSKVCPKKAITMKEE
jgi:pyruvate ferredoxin oxidoreductase delta subunit